MRRVADDRGGGVGAPHQAGGRIRRAGIHPDHQHRGALPGRGPISEQRGVELTVAVAAGAVPLGDHVDVHTQPEALHLLGNFGETASALLPTGNPIHLQGAVLREEGQRVHFEAHGLAVVLAQA